MEDFEHPANASLDEYLHSSYDPDVDFVDGELLDRLWGEWPHSAVRSQLLHSLRIVGSACGMKVLPSIRIRVSPTRIRVADIAVLSPKSKRTPIVEEPPALCIEVLEPQDNLERVLDRCRDFIAMGVPQVWMFDPEEREAYVLRDDVIQEHVEGILRLAGTPVGVSLKELFEALDEE